MPVFSYKALDARYLATSGTITADSPRQARDLLRSRRLLVEQVSVHRPRQHSWRSGTLLRPGRGDAAKVGQFVRQLGTLLAVGSPLMEALDTLSLQHQSGFRKVVLLVRDKVAAGESLAQAIAAQPAVFDELCVSLVQVGEDAGTLEQTLLQLAAFKERSKQLKNKLITALLYPSIVLAFAVGVSLFLMTSVVPNLLEPLLQQGRPLPLPTQWVKAVSDFLLADWIGIGAAVVLLLVTISIGWRNQRVRSLSDRVLLRIPLFGDLALKQSIVRMAIVMSTLLKSGQVFLRAIEITQKTASSSVIRQALRRCEIAVSAGGDIAEALESAKAFPPMVVHLFALGQQSGKLDEMLASLAEAYDAEVTTSTQRLAAVLEPTLILLLAGLVLCIVLATMLPILEAGDVLH